MVVTMYPDQMEQAAKTAARGKEGQLVNLARPQESSMRVAVARLAMALAAQVSMAAEMAAGKQPMLQPGSRTQAVAAAVAIMVIRRATLAVLVKAAAASL